MTKLVSSAVARKRILCVEDDQDTREMMTCLLGGYGYEVVVAASESDALETAKQGGLDLCILDRGLTSADGYDLCRQIRTVDSEMPIMFYSGAGFKADIQLGLDAGAQAYLVKPDFDHLKETIERLIAHSFFDKKLVIRVGASTV